MSNQVTSKSSEPSNIERADILSNKNKEQSVSIVNGIVNLMYFESILDDTVSAKITFADSGNAINDKNALNGLPICGSEKVYLKFSDNNGNSLEFSDTKTNNLYVNSVTPLLDDTTKSLVQLELVSKEFIMNDKVRLNERFDGKISDYLNKIFKDPKFLGSQKSFFIEPVLNNYNFIGNNQKPFYAANWLSKKSVSSEYQVLGNSAGFLFFETSEGYKFKSIDGLFSQEKKKSIIFNNTPDSRGENIPAGYDIKAIEYSKDNRVNIQKKLEMGAYSTRTIIFDPFDCYYEVINPVASESEDSLKIGGKELPSQCLNKEFIREGKNKEFSRTQYMLIDRGTLPSGDTSQQIEKSKEENFNPRKVLNQATMRYNQLFASQCEILIPGEFSLHAGDIVFLDVPPQDSEKSDQINKQDGGLYIIADLCHYLSPKETYTKLVLARDSFGRKGNHTSGSPS